jgi:hypothetical protein
MTDMKIRSFGHDAMYFQTVLKWCYTSINDLILLDTIIPLPDLPSIKYSHKKVTDSDIDQLIGTYSLRYVPVIEIIL